jgi:hypothetical protein
MASFVVTVSAPPDRAQWDHLEDLGVHRAVVFVSPVRIDTERNEPKRHPAPQHRSPGRHDLPTFVDAGLLSPHTGSRS